MSRERDTLELIRKRLGSPEGLSGLALPLAQGVILETRDRVPCQAPCMEPASPSGCGILGVLFVCLF